MSTKLILAFIAAVIAIASANGPFNYGYGIGHYGFGGLPYGGYLGFRKFGYGGFPGFNKLGYGLGYPYAGVSSYSYAPYYNGHFGGEYGYPYIGKDVSYAAPYKGVGYYGLPNEAVASAGGYSSAAAY